MRYVLDDKLLKKAGGLYKLVHLVFQRAKELNKEAKKLGKSQPSDSISAALEDFRQEKLEESKGKEGEKEKNE